MQQILVKRGLDIPMEGKAALSLGSLSRPKVYRVVPDHYAGISPKLMVKVGDKVKAGSALFHDKQFEAMLFTSPVSGTVTEVNEAIADDPPKVNEDCYGAWLIKVSDVTGTEELLDSKAYEEVCEKEA